MLDLRYDYLPKSPADDYRLKRLRNRDLPREDFVRIVRGFGGMLRRYARNQYLQSEEPYAVVVMRAGAGLWSGAENAGYFDEVGFINITRNEVTHQPTADMFKCRSNIGDKPVVIYETMLATGRSAALATKLVKETVRPSRIILLNLLAAPQGVKLMNRQHPDVTIVTANLDKGLDKDQFIVPGLGDAGDRLYGSYN